MLNNFGELLRLLDAGGIEFIVVGGVAVALNGYVRATEDVDIIVEPSQENIERLLAVLEGWGDGHARELSVEDFGIVPGAVRIIEDFPLDVFTILAEKTYHEYLPSSLSNEHGIRYLNPADVVHTKSRSLREEDKLDIAVMRRIIENTKT
jgi:acylphosphatase